MSESIKVRIIPQNGIAASEADLPDWHGILRSSGSASRYAMDGAMERSNGAESTPRPMAEEAYRVIRRDIIACVLGPGAVVTRAQLAARYGFGQAAVREALHRLDQERLVQVMPREGYVIAPITLKQVHDLLDARQLIEPLVARLAAGKVDPTAAWALHHACRTPERFTDRDELDRFIQANTAFHLMIARATGNHRLVTIVADLLDGMERLMHASYLLRERDTAVVSQQDELVEALLAADGPRAEQCMHRDIAFAREFVLAALHASTVLQSVNVFATNAQ